MKNRKLYKIAILAALFVLLLHPGASNTAWADEPMDSGGYVTTPIGSQDDNARTMIVQPDDKIVVAGYSVNSNGFGGNLSLVRYNPNGSLDSNFGS